MTKRELRKLREWVRELEHCERVPLGTEAAVFFAWREYFKEKPCPRP